MTVGGSEGPGNDKRCYMLIGLAVTDERANKKNKSSCSITKLTFKFALRSRRGGEEAEVVEEGGEEHRK